MSMLRGWKLGETQNATLRQCTMTELRCCKDLSYTQPQTRKLRPKRKTNTTTTQDFKELNNQTQRYTGKYYAKTKVLTKDVTLTQSIRQALHT